jgi:hypothetical protein
LSEWTYFAGGKASLEDGLDIVRRFGVIWRSSRNSAGLRIARLKDLAPGDTLHFTFRERGRCRYIFKARIGTPLDPAPGTTAIDRIVGAAAAELVRARYPSLGDGVVEVIHLLGVDEER